MLVDLTEEERDFLQRICARARLKLSAGLKYVTHKLDYDPDKLDMLREKLQMREERDLRGFSVNKGEDKIYAYYRFFDCLEDVYAYSRGFHELPCDIDYFKRFFEDRIKELELNKMINPDFSNRQALLLLRSATDQPRQARCAARETTKEARQ
jgi:hypothetical protein